MNIKSVSIQDFKGLQDISLNDFGEINAIVGKNNSGKSSILHALDMAGLALAHNTWNRFQPKLDIKDLFHEAGDFSLEITFEDDSHIEIKSNQNFGPVKRPNPNENQKFKSILIWPDVAAGMGNRNQRTPRWIYDQVENRNFQNVDSLEILYALKFYSEKNERGLTREDYDSIIEEIKFYPLSSFTMGSIFLF